VEVFCGLELVEISGLTGTATQNHTVFSGIGQYLNW